MPSMSPSFVKQSESNKDPHKIICEAYGCEELATETIGVDVGTFGILEFNLCAKCVIKFLETAV